MSWQQGFDLVRPAAVAADLNHQIMAKHEKRRPIRSNRLFLSPLPQLSQNSQRGSA
jgi:hypothetical protein